MGTPDQIRPGDVVMMPDFGPAHPGENCSDALAEARDR
jgi:hypothetical protein